MAVPVYLQPALILQQRPYRETSLLLEVFSRDFGILPMLAKGVRKPKSKLAGVLQPFQLVRLTFLDQNALKLLTEAELVESYPLQKLGLYCGFYLNELLQKFLHHHDPYPELFDNYRHSLQALQQPLAIETTLRYFELELLSQTGYAPELTIDSCSQLPVSPELRYNYQSGQGLTAAHLGHIAGRTLLQLAQRQALDNMAMVEAKRLLRILLDEHLQGKPLQSREVLAKMLKYL